MAFILWYTSSIMKIVEAITERMEIGVKPVTIINARTFTTKRKPTHIPAGA